MQLLRIASPTDIEDVGSHIERQLNQHSGKGVRRLIAAGSRLYALLQGDDVVSQLNIDLSARPRVDTPADLTFHLTARDAFLGFLYTSDRYRRAGAGRQLLELACHDLAQDGLQRVICHVSATNVPSLNTLSKAGWKRLGTFRTTKSGRLAVSPQLLEANVKVAPSLRA
jgi:ribosomal protein S18 acetylase RimI-like enzyme